MILFFEKKKEEMVNVVLHLICFAKKRLE